MIVYLIGTKAQYIKMAPVILETLRRGIAFQLVYSGQHNETFDELQANFGMPAPDSVLVGGIEAKDYFSFGGWVFSALRAIRASSNTATWSCASVIVVHGDTASALLGGFIGKRYRIPVAHIEAGLRSFNYFHPFPEEIIRVLLSRMSALHFCPDRYSEKNLQKTRGEVIHTHGNTLKDSLRLAIARKNHASYTGTPYAVFSMHRHENLFNAGRLKFLLSTLKAMSEIIPVKFVLHPVTSKRLQKTGLMQELEQNKAIEMVPRMDFFNFIDLIIDASYVATDGGSNQEECAMLGIPCLLLRKATERLDGLDDNVVISNYQLDRMLEFTRAHAIRPNKVRSLNFESPSKIIVDRLEAVKPCI